MQELSKKVNDLEKILTVTQEMSAEADLDKLLILIMERACSVVSSERCTLFVLDKVKDELWSKLSTNLEIDEIRIPNGVGIAGLVAKSGVMLNIPDAYADARFNQETDKKTGYRTKSILTVPLFNLNKEVVGVIQVLNSTLNEYFNDYDLFLLQTLASQIGVIIERAELLKSQIERQRLVHEMELASSIQRKLLPSSDFIKGKLHLSGWNLSCDETGGDYFDFFELDDDAVAVAIGDVSGHGISAALVMLEARALCKAFATGTGDISKILSRMNEQLQLDLDPEKFMTFFLGKFHVDKNVFEYSSAGHDDPLFYKAQDQKIYSLESTGTVLGFLEEAEFPTSDAIAIDVGDIFLFCTDGLFEARNQQGETFGKERIYNMLTSCVAMSASGLSEMFRREIQNFYGNEVQRDDITVVVAKMESFE